MNFQLLPCIDIVQEPVSGSWQWTIRHPESGTVLGRSEGQFYDQRECVQDLKVFGRMVTAFAVAKESSLGTAIHLEAECGIASLCYL